MESVEEVELLTGSPNRLAVLRSLREDESVTVRELVEHLRTTRRTVSRTLSTLEEAGYILRNTPDGHRLTAKGAYVVRSFEAFENDVDRVSHLEPFLANVTSRTFDLDPAHLATAEVLAASEGSPYAIVDRVLELKKEASTIQEVTPAVERKSVGQLADRIRDGADIDAQIIVSPSAREALRTNQDYARDHEVAADADTVEFFVHPDSLDLYLAILEGTVAIAVTRGDRPHALVVSEEPAVREWALDAFERYRSAARPFE